VFLLSQMIHNPEVNRDLISRGVRFLMDTSGRQLIPFEELKPDDIVIIPAFGTTIETEKKLEASGIVVQKYNTTCPFVERVWKKSGQLGAEQYTVIIHGKPAHEETRATFSHSAQHSPVIMVKDMEEAILLGEFIQGQKTREEFDIAFTGRTTDDFEPEKDLHRVGVINQTTMLATETQAIADYFKQVMSIKYGNENLKDHFADTRDTLCYATNENQESMYGLLEKDADIALVVGGYNSSNTSHLVELCKQKFPTYFIRDDSEIFSEKRIRHFDLHMHALKETENWLPAKRPVKIILTSGASCPDSVVDRVLQKVLGFFEGVKDVDAVLEDVEKN
ncbi:MAG TPA: 4-hydroxy-3-methylbut-2-enyl diphosphate reductase, partial [Bacteroidia bacterium]|nr:4-hydroxy-3-methylbut-2-enyl diphosphate reductase [Bacteroidia bacterium]